MRFCFFISATIWFSSLIFAFVFYNQSRKPVIYDVFVTTGQSNAALHYYAWGKGIRDTILNSGKFSNPIVINRGHSGQPIRMWFDNDKPQSFYCVDFFNGLGGALGNERTLIQRSGNVFRFRGLFWFQGEADGRREDVSLYDDRWFGMLDELERDLRADTGWNYVMNRVGNSGDEINSMLESITNSDNRGVLFDPQAAPFRGDPSDVHSYDHYGVGVGNAKLFIDSFVNPIQRLQPAQSQ